MLVAQFEAHYDSYKAAEYNEATLRIDFLNKFFKTIKVIKMLDPKMLRENIDDAGKNLARRGDPKIIQTFD